MNGVMIRVMNHVCWRLGKDEEAVASAWCDM